MMQWLIRASCRKPVSSPAPLPKGVVLRHASWLPRIAGLLAGMRGPAAAVTVGRTIVIHPSVRITQRLIAHELAHVRQWQEHRLFPLRYALHHLKYGYHDNPYEVEARNAEHT